MSKLKKVLLMCTAYVLVAALAIGGTVAYLQDSDSDVNVMTLGNVSIAQHEYERAIDANGNYETIYAEERGENGYKLTDFTQAKPLYPAVGSVSGWDSVKVCFEQLDGNKLGRMDVLDGINNVQDKFVFVENTGKTDAYVRTLIAYEVGSDTDAFGDLIKTSANTFWKSTRVGVIAIDGNNYHVVEYVYDGNQYPEGGEMVKAANGKHPDGIVHPGEYTYCSLAQVYMASKATNEDVEAIDGNKNGTYDILVVSQAVQAAGFADAETALDTAFGDITATNHPWANTTISSEVGITEAGTYDLKGDVYTIDSAYFHTQKVDAPVTINGNGATVEGIATSVDAFQWEGGTIPAMSAIFSSADGSKVTVNDLKFTGTMSAIMLGHYVDSSSNWYNTELNNVDVIGTEVVSFSAGVSPAVAVYGKAVLNNCNVYGTTLSELDTDPKWPVYDIAAVNYSNLTVKDSKIGSLYMWNQAKVTVADGSDVETVIVRGNMNTSEYGLTIEDGATVGAIDLSAITNKTKINITIEDGATVGKIIANRVEYATITDWQNA